jgi:hypothetical protein
MFMNLAFGLETTMYNAWSLDRFSFLLRALVSTLCLQRKNQNKVGEYLSKKCTMKKESIQECR